MRFPAKDWISIFIGMLALCISSTVAYFTIIRQTEELRVIVSDIPDIKLSEDGSKLILTGRLSLIFANLGTRAAAITHVLFEVAQPKDGVWEGSGCRGTPIATGIEPFVIKEKELVAKKAALRLFDRPNMSAQAEEVGISVESGNRHDVPWASFCLLIMAATPSDAKILKELELDKFQLPKGYDFALTDGAYFKTEPFLIWKRSNIILWDDR